MPLLDPEGDRYIHENSTAFDLGLDAKIGVSNNVTLDLTVNPDFAQVEADDQVANITRFSLFFPEKRRFFLEQTGNFSFGFGDSDRLFYSRTIGIENNQLVPLLGGARLVGQIGNYDLGILSVQSSASSVLGSENVSVARVKRQILNRNSFIGLMTANRLGENGKYETALGIDTNFRFGDEYILLNLAATQDSELDLDQNLASASRIRLAWQKPKQLGFGYDFQFGRSGKAYNPGVGFQARQDFTQFTLSPSFGISFDPEDSKANSLWTATSDIYLRNEDRQIETATFGGQYYVRFKNRVEHTIGVEYSYENLLEGYQLSKTSSVLPGQYDNLTASFKRESFGGVIFNSSLTLSAGRFFGGNRASIDIRPRMTFNKHFKVQTIYALDKVSFPDRNVGFIAHVLRWRADLALNTQVSFSTFIQYNSLGDVVIGNARFRYNPSEGTDLFLVVNNGYNTRRDASIPSLPLSTGTTILAKYTKTFVN